MAIKTNKSLTKRLKITKNGKILSRAPGILALIWSALIAVTTTIVALTTGMMTSVVSANLASAGSMAMDNQLEVFSVGIIIQCWISGFFIGKISEGNLGAGFKHSAVLALTAYASLVISQILLSGVFNIELQL